ncbi:MAG: DUF3313 domain-containing protein [Candidatus Omnitrophica bacterium]|nr:DUF3313 domain-containing protein [Candidatus Omnitrophota bacterium]MBU1996172.1 DUF3313 domain-containing protein [Candidatus Omnitrophota bacterium]
MFWFSKNRKIFLSLSIFLTSLIIFGCASKQLKPAGFLNDYSNVENGKKRGLFIDRSKEANLASYKKLIIAPVVVHFAEDAKGADVEPETLNEFTGFLHDQLSIALKGRFEIVDAPGEGVLLLRTALTDVLSSKVLLNIAWHTTLAGLGTGGAAMEAEFVDSMTQERVLAIVDSRKGNRAKYFNGWSKWKHTEDVFKKWAKLIYELVE